MTTEYIKYDFCKSSNCECFIPASEKYGIHEDCYFSNPNDCVRTAKEFHKWLNVNGYRIVKETPCKK